VVFDEILQECLALCAMDWREHLPLHRVEQSRFDPETAVSLKLSKQSQEDAHAACNLDHAAHDRVARANGDATGDRSHDSRNSALDSGKPPPRTKPNRRTRKASPQRRAR